MVLKPLAGSFWVCAVILLTQASCGEAAPSENSNVEPPNQATIQRVYIMKCSLCHGTDGKLMASKSPDLSTSTLSMEDRVALITYGKGTMPPQKGLVDASTISGLARYIESFRN